jgi:transcriptional regulator with XRE-family HTH domain
MVSYNPDHEASTPSLAPDKELLLRRGRNIKALRKAMKLTQDELGYRAGYESGSSMISQIEHGHTDISPEKCRRIAEVFGVDPWVLDGNFTKEQLIIIKAVFEKLLYQGKKFKYYNTILDLLGIDTK